MPNESTTIDRAAALRAALADRLCADGKITSPAVEAAFRTVAREHFLPVEVSLEIAYGVDNPVVTKRDKDGVAVSSVSAAYIQARMLEQAELRPGMTVLEIGSGGLNAALIAEVVGPHGRVVSVDIDHEVTDLAEVLLRSAGYADRVTVLQADAWRGVPDEGPFDATIVTVGTGDIAPAWLDQLTADGVLVLPLIMNGITRTIGFRRDDDHLASTSTELAGFVPLRGAGRQVVRLTVLQDANGWQVTLQFDAHVPADLGQLHDVLAAPRTEIWSRVTVPHQTSFADLHLWLAWFLPGFCLLSADDGTELAGEHGSWFPYAVVCGAAFAYLVARPTPDGDGVELGARAYGADGDLAAGTMVEQIQAWDRDGRHTTPTFGYWPADSDHSQIPAGTSVLDKTHGVVTIRWPERY
ncbi:methyltransferase, FxLD system [Phytohabitans sp. ZYX-F-186]|uniref:Protein-L-isoaspartate O-methyltransferase n=1 Tax=Phytohabitans maris TaxID=3071409 RepID=A0ABU0Z8Z6_9ACTN|nr:methyltransferase, FxLD system [Phytohabitans sp. ZYX-F-186]MDQ7903509.1 methyltransferase, FxLD system [Phytohabitans sp. ZYX-F-186]